MCGIIWTKRKDGRPANKSTLKRFQAQKTRGVQGFGFLALQGKEVVKWWQAETESGMHEGMADVKTDEYLFHHRFPTSTPNICEATHPIKVSNTLLKYDWFVVHNGVITNDEELKKKYEAEGFVFTTEIKTTEKKSYTTSRGTYELEDKEKIQFNDSESFAIDIVKAIEGDKATIDSYGSIAFMALQIDKVTKKTLKMYFGRNARNPLMLDDTKDIISITSAGKGKEVETNRLFYYDYGTGKIVNQKYLWIGASSMPDYSKHSNYWKREEEKDAKKEGIGFKTPVTVKIEDDKQPALLVPPKPSPIVSIFRYKDGIIEIDSDDVEASFEDVNDFENYYWGLVDEVEVVKDKLAEAKVFKDVWEIESHEATLRYLNKEMAIYEKVYCEIHQDKKRAD